MYRCSWYVLVQKFHARIITVHSHLNSCLISIGYASDNGFAAIKLTALGRPQLLVILHIYIDLLVHHSEVALRLFCLNRFQLC